MKTALFKSAPPLLACVWLALAASPARPQLMPGLRPPANAADAINQAQAMLCTLAAAGRPMPGLNMDLIGGEGVTALDAVPQSLARLVPKSRGQRIVQLKAPGEPVWVVHDAASRRCSIFSFTDAAAVQASLVAALDKPGDWERKSNTASGVDHAFEWDLGGSARLRTEISFPETPDHPVVVVVRPTAER